MKYILELDEEQYMHIAQCVEYVHRISCGDIDEIDNILPISPDKLLFCEIKRQSFPELERYETYDWNGGYNNDSVNEEFKNAFDKFQALGYQIYREMYHRRNLAKGIDNVYTSPTLTTDKAKQPIITIKDEE